MRGATILHVDLDAFFAAVEQRDRPELRGRPVVVGGSDPTRRGVVSAASYEARRFGVRSAMPLRTAHRLCPDAVFLPVDGARYAAVSRAVMAILRRFSPLVEQVSIDEAFLDVAGTEALHGSPEAVARAIRAAIASEERLTASVGVAGSRLVAKIASDLRKPDALVVVPAGTEADFLAPLPIGRLWGVGEKTRAALAELGVRTIGDLAALPEDVLLRRLGANGPLLLGRARGVDPTPVGTGEAAKSVGHEHTFPEDTSDAEAIDRTLLALADGVARRLRTGGVRAATVTVKVRDATFATHTRQRTLAAPTDDAAELRAIAAALAAPLLRGARIRLLGIAASGLTDREQLGLFDDPTGTRGRAARAERAADAVRARFGSGAIVRARLLGSDVAEPFARDPRHAPEAPRVGAPGPGTASPPEDPEVPQRRDTRDGTQHSEHPRRSDGA
ncbi:MAG: DNA polymerase IV [Chloroflexota bacterium]